MHILPQAIFCIKYCKHLNNKFKQLYVVVWTIITEQYKYSPTSEGAWPHDKVLSSYLCNTHMSETLRYGVSE